MNTPYTFSPDKPAFHGESFIEARDGERLGKQKSEINKLMSDSEWRSLSMIQYALDLIDGVQYPQASISARLRSARQPKHGGFSVERRYVSKGLWEYRYAPQPQQATD